MRELLKQLRADHFWRHNAIFLTGTLLVALFTYLYYPVLGRLLDVASFGEMQSLLAIFNGIGMLLGAVNVVAIIIAVNHRSTGPAIIREIEQASLLAVGGFSVLMILLSPVLQHYLGFATFWPFIILACILTASVPLSFSRAFIQGKRKFAAASTSSILSAAGKLVLSAACVLAGFKTGGAMVGIFISQLIALAYTLRIATKLGFLSAMRSSQLLPNWSVIRPQSRAVIGTMLVFFMVTVLYTGDLLIVKRYFEPETAGLYAGVAAIAKIIFFATASFAGVLLASTGLSFEQAHNRRVFRRSLILVVATSCLILIPFCLLPETTIHWMIGSKYETYAAMLPVMGLTISATAITYLCAHYYLAQHDASIVIFTAIGGCGVILLSLLRHTTIDEVIYNFLLGNLLVLGLIVAREVTRSIRGHQQ